MCFGAGFYSLSIIIVNKAVIILADGVFVVDMFEGDSSMEFLVCPDHDVREGTMFPKRRATHL